MCVYPINFSLGTSQVERKIEENLKWWIFNAKIFHLGSLKFNVK